MGGYLGADNFKDFQRERGRMGLDRLKELLGMEPERLYEVYGVLRYKRLDEAQLRALKDRMPPGHLRGDRHFDAEIDRALLLRLRDGRGFGTFDEFVRDLGSALLALECRGSAMTPQRMFEMQKPPRCIHVPRERYEECYRRLAELKHDPWDITGKRYMEALRRIASDLYGDLTMEQFLEEHGFQ